MEALSMLVIYLFTLVWIPAFAGMTTLWGHYSNLKVMWKVLIKLHNSQGNKMLNKQLLEILACPKCKGELEYDAEKDLLRCHKCRLIYKIEDDIPNMLIDEAKSF